MRCSSSFSPTPSPAVPARWAPLRASPSAILDLHEVGDPVQHAADLLVVLDLDRLADFAQAGRARRLALGVIGAVLRLGLRDLHSAGASSAGSASAGGCS